LQPKHNDKVGKQHLQQQQQQHSGLADQQQQKSSLSRQQRQPPPQEQAEMVAAAQSKQQPLPSLLSGGQPHQQLLKAIVQLIDQATVKKRPYSILSLMVGKQRCARVLRCRLVQHQCTSRSYFCRTLTIHNPENCENALAMLCGLGRLAF
jgi:hypothetical protein